MALGKSFNFSELYCPNLYKKILPTMFPPPQGSYEIQRRSCLWECFINFTWSCDNMEITLQLLMVTGVVHIFVPKLFSRAVGSPKPIKEKSTPPALL